MNNKLRYVVAFIAGLVIILSALVLTTHRAGATSCGYNGKEAICPENGQMYKTKTKCVRKNRAVDILYSYNGKKGWVKVNRNAFYAPKRCGDFKKTRRAKETVDKHPIRVITHNIAGAMTHLGSPVALQGVENHIADYNPHLVLLQEVCSSQVDALKAAHPDWNVHVSQHRFSHPGCDGDPTTVDPTEAEDVRGDELYDVVASPRPMRNPQTINLGEESHSRVQHLTCAEVAIAGVWVTGCTTHIKSAGLEEQAVEFGGMEPGQRLRQIKRVAWWTEQFRNNTGNPVVVGGDFNSLHDSEEIQPMLRYQEYYRGIDYVFYAGMRTTGLVSGSYHNELSDHPLVRAKGYFK